MKGGRVMQNPKPGEPITKYKGYEYFMLLSQGYVTV